MGTANSTTLAERGNPVLAYFGGFSIQPYWLIIVQLLSIQVLQRTYSYIDASFKRGKKKHIYIPLELAVLGEEFTKVSPPKYSILDFVLSLVSVAQFCYACYRQRECSSKPNESVWRCYNAFGYRLFNYVLPSVVSVLVACIVQGVNTSKANKLKNNVENDTTSARWAQVVKESKYSATTLKMWEYFKWFLLVATAMLNVALCSVFVPYLITNALPMFVGFCWLLIPLIVVLTIAYATFITTTVIFFLKCKKFKDPADENTEQSTRKIGFQGFFKLFGSHCAVGLQVFGCLALGMAYNYSQYCYFGGGYLSVLGLEFYSRDTGVYFANLNIDGQLRVQTILAFF